MPSIGVNNLRKIEKITRKFRFSEGVGCSGKDVLKALCTLYYRIYSIVGCCSPELYELY